MSGTQTRKPTGKKAPLVRAAVAVLLAFWIYRAQHDPVRDQVLDILRTNTVAYLDDDVEVRLLQELGPDVFPTLAELIEWRRGFAGRAYNKLWNSLPASLRNRLPDPRVPMAMHVKAVQIAEAWGPAAVRPLTSALCHAVGDPDVNTSIRATRSIFFWSIPESPKATATFTHWLSDPARSHLIGHLDSPSIFAQLPDAVPRLIPWLKSPRPNLAHEVAYVLGELGEASANAIPSLIVVSDQGYDNTPPGIWSPYTPARNDDARRQALTALGRIGVASPGVMAALSRGLADTNATVRFAALQSFHALNQPPDQPLLDVLNSLAPHRDFNVQKVIEWVGSLGTNGQAALPWIMNILSPGSERLPAPDDPGGGTGWSRASTLQYREAALRTLGRIDPELVRPYLPEMIAHVAQRWETVEFLMDCQRLAPEIVLGLEPVLNETNHVHAAKVAYIILGLQADHQGALTTLRTVIAEGRFYHRLLAASWYWKRTGATKDFIPLCIEGLSRTENTVGQVSADMLGALGPEARPAIPALKAALQHPDRFARNNAGKALQKIAPEELPPIDPEAL